MKVYFDFRINEVILRNSHFEKTFARIIIHILSSNVRKSKYEAPREMAQRNS